ncbi:MAG: M20/M25/M40 family metallo-hydrolase [Thermoplasmata archaeon]|nr:MAG: M20/M25/M40 family metallo-hydrolase [Thermoplasmata archaeon]
MKFIVCFAIIMLLLPFPSYGERDESIEGILDEITEELLREYIQTLQDFGPRVTGSIACREAAEYIEAQFEEYGLIVREDNWTYHGYEDINIEATLTGENTSSDEIYIICAHYDSVPGSPGADDNGSGTAAVLAAAKVLSKYKFEHTIRFVTFSGEEQGLLGSREYAAEAYENGDNIVAVLNADMIGYAETNEGRTHVIIEETESSSWITNIAINMSIEYEIGLEIVREPSYPYSDHASFLQYGFDAIFFFEYEFNEYYHSSEDTIDKMDLDYATRVTKLIVATLIELAGLKEGDYENPIVKIEKPHGHLYINNREIIPLPHDSTIVIGKIEIEVYALDNESGIDSVEFYIDGRMVAKDEQPPYQWLWDERALLLHKIGVKAYDRAGNEGYDEVKIWIFNF